MKRYTFNFTKYFLITLVMSAGFTGVAAYSKEMQYDKLYTGEANEYVSIDKISNGFNISVVNSVEEEGSTTAYFSPSKEEDLTDFGCFSFDIKNKSEGEIKLNFILNESSKSYILEENQVILVLKNGESTLRRINVSNGVFELEEGFEGTVYVPFRSLKEKAVNEIISWGMTITCQNGESKNFDIKNFKHIENKEAGKFNNIAKAKITGDVEMPVPSVGEAIVDFKSEKPVKFYLKDEHLGAGITEDGHLAVNSEVKEGDINVFAALDSGEEFYFKVNVKEGLTKSLKGVTNKSLATPALDEVVNKENSSSDFLLNNKVMYAFRFATAFIVVLISAVYLYWRGYFKKFTKDK